MQIVALRSLLLAVGLAGEARLHADEAMEERLRAQLKQSATEVRSLKDEIADLRLQVEKLKADAASSPAAKKEEIPVDDVEGMKRLLAEQARSAEAQQAQAAQHQQVLDQWKEAYEQAVTVARQRDLTAREADARYRALGAHVESCEHNNATLVGISEELLDRYRNKGVIETVRQREPLLGLDRVALEHLAQEYHARILDATVRPAAEGLNPVPECVPPAAAAPAPAAAPAAVPQP